MYTSKGIANIMTLRFSFDPFVQLMFPAAKVLPTGWWYFSPVHPAGEHWAAPQEGLRADSTSN
jgi:hypothetical protein